MHAVGWLVTAGWLVTPGDVRRLRDERVRRVRGNVPRGRQS